MFHWPLYQLDIKNAFLYGEFTEAVYMNQPPEFIAQGSLVGVSTRSFSLWTKAISNGMI